MKTPRKSRAFSYREGVRIPGTDITCDARGFPSDLVFLSHAHALAPHRPTELASGRAGRRQVVTTETTLRLLGEAGADLRTRALPAAFGRPFNLGAHRLEVVPSGFMPGAAALLCETDAVRAFYLGAFCGDPVVEGIEGALFRRADAICINATAAHPELGCPPRRQALADVRAFAEEGVRAALRTVILGSAFDALPAVAGELARAGIALRAHPRIAAVLARLHRVHDSIPAVHRFSGKLESNEVLLWPSEARNAAGLASLGAPRLALVGSSARDPAVLGDLRLEHGFPLTHLPSFTDVLAALAATGAQEVALVRGPTETVAAALRERGYDAYPLGPPRQMTLLG
jgi:putative mRNA 3-end processing factor